MTTRRTRRLLAATTTVLCLLLMGMPAVAQPVPPAITVADGVTQPVFSYADAVREVVQITSAVSSHDGPEPDIITVDLIRPRESGPDLRVPTIIIPSPYYSGPGRGREGQRKPTPPATPSIVAGEHHAGGSRLAGSLPVTGQAGPLVHCGRALSPADCPPGTAGAVALVERGGDTFAAKAANVVAAGGVGIAFYNDEDGPFTGDLGSGVPIPAIAISRADGLLLLDALEDGPLPANLRELVQPIDFFPLYYDNYFVPRGYAVAYVDLPGSRYSTGCLDVGGPGEVGAAEATVEWLAGNRPAVSGVTGQPVVADWSNGLSGMTGKSWDGTIPIAVAERATEGLATIVTTEGLSHWHSDFWTNGARYGGSPTQWFDGNSNNPAMRGPNPTGTGAANAGRCSGNRAHLLANQENPDGNSDFWLERNWIDDVGSFEASVFVIHGTNDYNVPPVNFGRLYEALVEHDVPRKLWLSQVAHEKAFDFRREAWIPTIHRWYDRWLHGIDNGIDREPRADVEHAPDQWTTYDDWANGSRATKLWFDRSVDADDPRLYTLWPDADGIAEDAEANLFEIRRSISQYTENPFAEDVDAQGRIRRLAFLSPPLAEPVHMSGEAILDLRVRIGGANAQNTTFTAAIVDYGTAPRRQHTSTGGVLTVPGSSTCFGQGTAVDTGCFLDVVARVHTPDRELVTRGNAQIGFHNGLSTIDPDVTYPLTFGFHHQDYVFPAGHRIGIVVAGPETRLQNGRHPTSNRPITLELGESGIQLPVVGGHRALGAAFDAWSFSLARAQLDALVADGGITPSLEDRIRHALDMAEEWLPLPRKLGPALSHLDRAVRLLEWQADVVDRTGKPQGDPVGLRDLAASIRALHDALDTRP